MTVGQLKTWLQGKAMSVSGKKKDELIEGVEEYFEQKR